MEWAVNLLRRARAEHGQEVARKITTKELVLEAWGAIPEEERQKISKRGANMRTAKNYFCFKAGVKLTMESLWEIAEIANAPEREDEDDTSGTSDEDGGSAHSQNEDMWEACAHSQNEGIADAAASPAAGEVACRDEIGRRSELRAFVGGRNMQ
jgi:hypothetical protein